MEIGRSSKKLKNTTHEETTDISEIPDMILLHILLIGYAINREVKVLDLNFMGCSIVSPSESYVLPDVFRSNYLEDISEAIKLCREISLKALRVLLLNKVSWLCDEIMENILLGCPLLEELSLIDCYGLRNLCCDNPNLKKLMVTLSTCRVRFYVSCPHVMSLEIAGWIERATLSTVSSLCDASISFSYLFRPQLRPYANVQRLLQEVSRCRAFTPCGFTILMLTIWNFIDVPCASYRWKNLLIKLSLTKWHHPGLSWLFKSSPSLKTLTMYVRPDSDSFFKHHASNWIPAYDFDGESFWNLQEARFPCLECIIISWLYKRALCRPNVEVSAKKCNRVAENGDISRGNFRGQLG